MARSTPASRLFLALAVTVAGLTGACSDPSEMPTALTPDEERLVEEVLSLIEVRIARARDFGEGVLKREALPPLYSPEDVEAMIYSLAEAPERGQLVVGAVHESLRARREKLLRPSHLQQ